MKNIKAAGNKEKNSPHITIRVVCSPMHVHQSHHICSPTHVHQSHHICQLRCSLVLDNTLQIAGSNQAYTEAYNYSPQVCEKVSCNYNFRQTTTASDTYPTAPPPKLGACAVVVLLAR